MTGAFGACDVWHDSLVELGRLVEANPAVCVFSLYREGLLTPGIEARIGGNREDGGYLTSVPEPGKVLLDGQPIRLVWHRMLPARVFICPSCGRESYRLHRVNDAWACRRCHRLDYACRHRGRTIPGLARIRSLRRRIGASSVLFSPLPAKPLQARKHWRLAREIRQLEARLIDHGRSDVAEVLERRHERS